MHRRFFSSRFRAGGLPLALAAGLALMAGACMSPSAKKSTAEGAAGVQAARAGSGQQSGVKGKNLTWWQRLRRYHREPEEKPWVYGDVRPGKGLLGNDEDGFVLLRKGEGQSPARSGKPEKVRR